MKDGENQLSPSRKCRVELTLSDVIQGDHVRESYKTRKGSPVHGVKQ